MKRFALVAVFVVSASCSLAAQSVTAAPGPWSVARSPHAFPGACYVGKPPFFPPHKNQYTQFLANGLATLKDACVKAANLSTGDDQDDTKCFTYSSFSLDDCKNAGAPLPTH